MPLRTDDGSPLPVKEGIILDQSEEVVLYESKQEKHSNSARGAATVRTFQLGFWSIPVILGMVSLVLAFGTFILGIFLMIFLTVSLIRGLLRLLGLRV